MCGANHSGMSSQHGGKKVSDRDCTLACVEEGGKYVFVSNNKVYDIENQQYSGLQVHAGHSVRLSGELIGSRIKVSGIEMQSGR